MNKKKDWLETLVKNIPYQKKIKPKKGNTFRNTIKEFEKWEKLKSYYNK